MKENFDLISLMFNKIILHSVNKKEIGDMINTENIETKNNNIFFFFNVVKLIQNKAKKAKRKI